MKRRIVYLIACILLVSFASLGLSNLSSKVEAASNDSSIDFQLSDFAKDNGLTKVDPNLIPEDKMMNFNSVEDFEKFIQKDESATLESSVVSTTTSGLSFNVLSASSSSTKTYKTTEYNATGKITAYARVTRKSSKKVSKVKIWSEQSGVIFGITYTPNDSASYYKLNSSKTGGKAYAKGTKLYGANIGGQSVGYIKHVTYTIKF